MEELILLIDELSDEVKSLKKDNLGNILTFANDYKMFGEESYVFANKEYLHKLYETYPVSMNDLKINGEVIEYIATKKGNVGFALANVHGIEQRELLGTLATMQAVANSSTAMQAVANSSTAMQAVANSSTAMQAVLSSSTGTNAITNNKTALLAISKSSIWSTILGYMTSYNRLKNSFNSPGASRVISKGYYLIVASGDFGDSAEDGARGGSSAKQIYCEGVNQEWDKKIRTFESQFGTNNHLEYRNVRWGKYSKPVLVTSFQVSDNGSTDNPSSLYTSDQEGFLYF